MMPGCEDDPAFLLNTKEFNRELVSRGYTAAEVELMRKTRRTLRNRHYKRASRAQKKSTKFFQDSVWRQWKAREDILISSLRALSKPEIVTWIVQSLPKQPGARYAAR